MTQTTWVLASNNQGKIAEIQSVLTPFGITLLPQREFNITSIDETGLTFVENALLKARHAARIAKLPALADDSGLAVAALAGAPGIFSARFAGINASDAANIDHLLQTMQTIPMAHRQAHYYCALVLMQSFDDPSPWLCEGHWHGEILTAPRGDGGFGYDPIFKIATSEHTAAELPAAEKNRLSHRGQALGALLQRLAKEKD